MADQEHKEQPKKGVVHKKRLDVIEKQLAISMNLFDLIGFSLVLLMAGVVQLVSHELPCPECLLQRLGMFAIAFGLMMNLQFGARIMHYILSLLSALFMGMVALRQMSLHFSGGGYGDPILGLHLYTWSFLIAVAFIVFTLLGMLMDRQFTRGSVTVPKLERYAIHFFMGLVIVLCLFNGASTLLECGLGFCPSDPTHYKLLNR